MATKPPVYSDDLMPHFPGMLDLSMPSPMMSGIEVITEREFANVLDYELFMHDVVVVRIHPTSDVRAAPFVFVGVNGDSRWLPRDLPVKLQRKHVEVLARSKEMQIRTQETRDPNADDRSVVRRTTSSPYGFELMWDKHPKGRAWLSRVMAEAQ